MRTLTPGALALMLSLAPAVAGAQILDGRPERWSTPTRWDLAFAVDVVQPTGEFGRFVENGWGGDAQIRYRLDRGGLLSLRAEAGFIQYGSETNRYRLLPGTGRIQVDVKTTNDIFLFSFGPELAMQRGLVRPFVNAGVSFAGFSTNSHIEGSDSNDGFARTDHQKDGTFLYSAGGGLRIPVGPERWRSGITLAARWHGGGRAEYLREGSITEDDNGDIHFTPIRSRIDFMSYSLGVTWNLSSGERK